MKANDQVHNHTRRIREQPLLHILHLLEKDVPVVRHKHLVAQGVEWEWAHRSTSLKYQASMTVLMYVDIRDGGESGDALWEMNHYVRHSRLYYLRPLARCAHERCNE